MSLVAPLKSAGFSLALTFLGTLGIGLLEPSTVAARSAPVPVLTADAVAVSDRYSADAAQQIFAAGGNAVDAGVAIAFTLAVTYPEAGNIGGGGFMTLYVDGKPYFLDYRERAPQAASRDMYLDSKGEVIDRLSLIGPRSAGVPGTVEGMWQAQQRFGKLKWDAVLAPAIAYARDGFVVDKQLQQRHDDSLKDFSGKTNFETYFHGLKQGEVFRQPDLAAALLRMAEQGEKDFYEGKTADLIAAAQAKGGLITKADLKSYKAVWREPILADWNGYQIVTAPPPSSGGIFLVQMLKMKADLLKLFEGVGLNTPQYIHLIAEIEKRVFADRAQYLGDADFYQVPVAQLVDPAYIAKRASEVNPNRPSDTKSVQAGLGAISLEKAAPEQHQTTHFSVIDRWGNAVSNTYTLNGDFGSGVVVDGAGILLNDEMDDFSAKPGVANMFGVVGSDANAIVPNKRPLSSMTPTILLKDGKVAMVIGTPGGSRIFTSVFQVITDIYDFKLPLKDALAALRFHHQLLPANTIFWEPYMPMTGALAKQLEDRGYVLAGQDFDGDMQVIRVNSNTPEAAADPRGRGVARVMPH
jgi:gamma-glutamyltranspeptidase / glutathione hydrolase